MGFIRRFTQIALPGRYRSGVLALVLAALVTPARAEYRLQPGDVLEVLVAGIPDFRQHLTVGLEGNIGLPLAGEVKVGGLPLTQAQQRIAAGLGNKLYRQYTPDGREISHLIIGSEVVVEVSEYSPIYVSGDVAKPGAYPFRPGLTIRQAIAVAGGYNPMRIPGTDPMLQAADLQSQYQTFMTEYQADIALTWRLNRELNDDGQASSDKQPAAPVGVAEAFVKGEIKQFDARKADRESVKAMLQDAMKKASLQLALLAEKRSKDEQGSEADAADFASVRGLFQKGLAPSSRLADARRAALMSSEQLLQTVSGMADIERQRDEYADRKSVV